MVDLPAPFGPSRAVMPTGNSQLTSFSPITWPYQRDTRSNVINGHSPQSSCKQPLVSNHFDRPNLVPCVCNAARNQNARCREQRPQFWHVEYFRLLEKVGEVTALRNDDVHDVLVYPANQSCNRKVLCQVHH